MVMAHKHIQLSSHHGVGKLYNYVGDSTDTQHMIPKNFKSCVTMYHSFSSVFMTKRVLVVKSNMDTPNWKASKWLKCFLDNRLAETSLTVFTQKQ